MNNLILLSFALLAFLGFFVLFLIYYFSGARKGFYRKGKIMTDGEFKFYKSLRSSVYGKYELLCQVRLAAIVNIPESAAFFWKHFKPIGAKSVDFVLCNKENGETVLVIELDDKTHLEERRQKRDKFVDEVLKSAGIPILHLKPQKFYQNEELKQAINEKIKANYLPVESKAG